VKIGSLSDYINRKTVTIFVIQFVAVVSFFGYQAWCDSSAECVRCHGDRETMTRLGYPQFHMTRQMVEKESRHPNVTCRDCHLGNGRATDAARAHEGMLRPLFVGYNAQVLDRKKVAPEALVPRGDDAIRSLMPASSGVRNVLWHDRDPVTFNFDPEIARTTCGKSNCHPEQVKQFTTTIMATNFRQRTMRSWLEPYGPQN
jgi:hypothetical protein